jgi:outer membrane protein assembly factor BamB
VFVATENDYVYALSSLNGSVIWVRHVASAVASSLLPCGDIAPSVGVTGTPVIDVKRHEIFFVADAVVHATVHHELFALSTQTGAVELRKVVDPPGANPAALLQRTGLTLDDGSVVFAMGGNYGDCNSYRGRVVSVAEDGSTLRFFTVDARAGESQGAIWMGGAAPVVDARGNVWVSVGNGSVRTAGQPYDDSDSLLELTSLLHLRQYFAPSNWAANNSRDLDMSASPALLSNAQVVLAGKSSVAYLLNGDHLGGIGHQEASVANVCSGVVDGGTAVRGDVVYLPCTAGPVALRVTVSPPALHLVWRSTSGGGPPIVAGGLVWSMGMNGDLYGLNLSTGRVHQVGVVGALANHFSTPSVGDGLLLASSAHHVVAFRASAAR